MPHGTVDSIVTASNLVVSMQTIVSRNTNPRDACVCGIGKIEGGFAANVVADRVRMYGSVRTLSEETRQNVKSRLKKMCSGVGEAYGACCELTYHDNYPPTVSTEAESKLVRAAALKVVGETAVVAPHQTMAGEDFSFFLQQRPGCFFFVGSAPPGKDTVSHHRPDFDIGEAALAIGSSIWVNLALEVIPA